MTAKEYLSQAYWLDRRINSKLEQLSSLNDIATRSTSVMSDDVVSRTRNVHAMEDVIAKIVDMKAEVNAEIDRLVDLKRDMWTTRNFRPCWNCGTCASRTGRTSPARCTVPKATCTRYIPERFRRCGCRNWIANYSEFHCFPVGPL